jgi:hypothetical protein
MEARKKISALTVKELLKARYSSAVEILKKIYGDILRFIS